MRHIELDSPRLEKSDATVPARKASVLVVDDDVRMLRLMQRILELEGYRVVAAESGADGLNELDGEDMDLVLLDVMMPGMDGYAVCRHIREFSEVPVIMVTAKGSEEEKVQGLDAGADDYVTKPFSSKELTARVRAVLRRSKLWEEPPCPLFRLGDLEVDCESHRVIQGGRGVNLTVTEFNLLSYLVHNAGCVVAPDQILDRVWGEEYRGETHILQVNMSRLRQKLNDGPGEPKYILTRPGIGYMMVKPPG
ncbi:MAG: response regulator transcription factor [Chloroflexi bacterium]|nr:response regulator transcription factor [Chloroflexota bacterium]